MINDIKILPVGAEDQQEVIAFVMEARKQLFPMLNHDVMPNDLQRFSSTYVDVTIGVFLQARTSQGKLIGTIGMMVYDHRFPYLSFPEGNTVEVVKLFVEPAYRKSGLGTRLMQALEQVGREQGVTSWYLHTHPFLEGAYAFWLKQGFNLELSCEESGFETWHMASDKTKVMKKDDLKIFADNNR